MTGKGISSGKRAKGIGVNGTTDTVLDISQSPSEELITPELGERMRNLIVEGLANLVPDAVTEVGSLMRTAQKEEVRLRASFRVLDQFVKEKEAPSRPQAIVQVVNKIGMAEAPAIHGRPVRMIEVAGVTVSSGIPERKVKEKKVVLAREENWRTKTEKAVDSKRLDQNPALIGTSPEPKTAPVAALPEKLPQ
jgi:hypothetical protein